MEDANDNNQVGQRLFFKNDKELSLKFQHYEISFWFSIPLGRD
jgi:hypothetical protein